MPAHFLPRVHAHAAALLLGACLSGTTVCARAAIAQPGGLAAPPTLGAPRPLVPPVALTRPLPNGLQLVIVPQHELPLVDVQLVVRNGGDADPPERAGLATLTASMLLDGAGDRDALAIAGQTAFLGISLRSGASLDRTTVALHAPTAVLDSALALMADVVRRPSFPAAEFERRQRERETALLQRLDRGPAIADQAFQHLLYGDAHPYGTPLDGTQESVRAITRDDVATFWRTWYRPGNATLVVTGDVEPDDIERRLRVLFGDWEDAPVPTVRYPAPPAARATTIALIDKPGAPQSSFRLGGVAVARATPDYYPLMVANTILGGSFTSRLNMNLRETHAYTYGAGSAFALNREPGPFRASAEIVRERSDSALLEFMRELRAIREPVPAAELEKAKQYLVLGFADRFETTSDLAGQFAALAAYGLPLDTYAGYQAGIGAVTAADVQRVTARYIRPDALTIVIVGDRAAIEAPLRATGVAPVELRDARGRPLPVP